MTTKAAITIRSGQKTDLYGSGSKKYILNHRTNTKITKNKAPIKTHFNVFRLLCLVTKFSTSDCIFNKLITQLKIFILYKRIL